MVSVCRPSGSGSAERRSCLCCPLLQPSHQLSCRGAAGLGAQPASNLPRLRKIAGRHCCLELCQQCTLLPVPLHQDGSAPPAGGAAPRCLDGGGSCHLLQPAGALQEAAPRPSDAPCRCGTEQRVGIKRQPPLSSTSHALMASMFVTVSSLLRTCGHVLGGALQLHALQLALPLQSLPLPLGSRSLLAQQQSLQLGTLGLQNRMVLGGLQTGGELSGHTASSALR